MTPGKTTIRELFGGHAVASLLLAVTIALAITACERSGTTTPRDSIARVAEDTPPDSAPEASRGAAGVGFIPASTAGGKSDIAEKIRLAFDTDALREVQLVDVECGAQLCSVSFEADPDLPVRKMLAHQLAETSHSVATVHAGGPNRLHVAIPANEPNDP